MDQPAAIGHTEGWSAIARGLCGLEISDARLREGSRLKAGGFRSGRGVPLAHAPVRSDLSVEEGGDVGPSASPLGWTGSVRALNDVLTLEIDGAVKPPLPRTRLYEPWQEPESAPKGSSWEGCGARGLRCARTITVVVCVGTLRRVLSIVDYALVTRVTTLWGPRSDACGWSGSGIQVC